MKVIGVVVLYQMEIFQTVNKEMGQEDTTVTFQTSGCSNKFQSFFRLC